MTDVLTPGQVNRWLIDVSDGLERAVAEGRQASVDVVRADRMYKAVWCAAFDAAVGTVRERENQADLASLDERETLKEAEKRERWCDLEVRSRMQQLSSFQTIGSSVREEHRYGRTGPEMGP